MEFKELEEKLNISSLKLDYEICEEMARSMPSVAEEVLNKTIDLYICFPSFFGFFMGRKSSKLVACKVYPVLVTYIYQGEKYALRLPRLQTLPKVKMYERPFKLPKYTVLGEKSPNTDEDAILNLAFRTIKKALTEIPKIKTPKRKPLIAREYTGDEGYCYDIYEPNETC